MSKTDKIITELFQTRWCGDYVLSSLENMKDQLAKTLRDQVAGYWSGHTAYHIAVDGGFLNDAKSGEDKILTSMGLTFMSEMNQRGIDSNEEI